MQRVLHGKSKYRDLNDFSQIEDLTPTLLPAYRLEVFSRRMDAQWDITLGIDHQGKYRTSH